MIPGLRARHEEVVKPRQTHGVLVIDEAAPVRNSLGEILKKLGADGESLRILSCREDALFAFRQERPRMVFTELVGSRPELGLAMVLEMLELAPETKIILVTAEDPDGPIVRAAVRAGVFAVVEKPLRHEKIRHVLMEVENEEGGIERLR